MSTVDKQGNNHIPAGNGGISGQFTTREKTDTDLSLVGQAPKSDSLALAEGFLRRNPLSFWGATHREEMVENNESGVRDFLAENGFPDAHPAFYDSPDYSGNALYIHQQVGEELVAHRIGCGEIDAEQLAKVLDLARERLGTSELPPPENPEKEAGDALAGWWRKEAGGIDPEPDEFDSFEIGDSDDLRFAGGAADFLTSKKMEGWKGRDGRVPSAYSEVTTDGGQNVDGIRVFVDCGGVHVTSWIDWDDFSDSRGAAGAREATSLIAERQRELCNQAAENGLIRKGGV